MHNTAHVSLRAHARAQTQLTGAHRALITRTRTRTGGEAAARHLDTCN
jgi:hypothetical protein